MVFVFGKEGGDYWFKTGHKEALCVIGNVLFLDLDTS